MDMKLLGFRTLDFTTEDGAVKGTQIFTGNVEEGVTGLMTDKFFIRDGMELPALTVGMTLDVEFNRKGRVVAVKAVVPTKS